MVGPNGAGKTNLLEGLHVATQAFSPRTRADRRVVQFDQQAARAAARGRAGSTPFESEVTIRSTGPKSALLNGTTTSTEELRRRLPVLAFVPDRLAVVKGGPVVRRTYFDRMLARVRPARGQDAGRYAAALAQRNAALRRVAASLAPPSSIEPWDSAVAELGTRLDAARAGLVETIAGPFYERCGHLGLAAATLTYEHEPLQEHALAAARDRDIHRGATTSGPHLRDIEIRCGGRELRGYGSQGQQRLAVLGLLLAEAELLAEERGLSPLLLLDDVLSELDGDRRRDLLASLALSTQTVLTTAVLDDHLEGEADPASVVRVQGGTATELAAA